MTQIKIDKLSDVIMKELSDYSSMTNEKIKEVIIDVSTETKKTIASTAPKRSGKYAKSWAVKKLRETSNTLHVVVHSKNKYQLTHLLEFGHAKRSGGRVSARPHIESAEKQMIEQFESNIKEVLENG